MKKIIFISIILFGLSLVAEAQSLDGLLRKAKRGVGNAAEDKVEKVAEQEASKFLDKLFQEDSTKSEETQQKTASSDYSRLMKSLGVNSHVEKKDLYRFDSQTKMIFESTDKKGKEQDPVNFLIQSNENNGDLLFNFINEEGQTATFISDMDNEVTLMLTEKDGVKSGLATTIDINDIKIDDESTSDSNDDDCFAKTGKSRKISGYLCNEYRCENDDEIISAWLTTELKMKNNQMFGNNPFGANYKQGRMKGMIIEYNYVSKTDKSSSKMLITNIDEKKSSSFSTEGYEIISFSYSPE